MERKLAKKTIELSSSHIIHKKSSLADYRPLAQVSQATIDRARPISSGFGVPGRRNSATRQSRNSLR